MKIAVCSDLHLEFGPIELKNTEGADVLVLAGDICVERDLMEIETVKLFHKSNMYHNFFQNCCKEFKNVIYIAGNHEHYNGDYKYTISNLKKNLSYLPNLHMLEKEVFTLDDVTFICGTLWTDMNKRDPITLLHVKDGMNDFRLVRNSDRYVYRNVPIYENDENGRPKIDEKGFMNQIGMKKKEEPSRFSPEDSVVDHEKMVDFIRQVVSEKLNDKFVVVGHHAPSRQSTHPRYQSENILNGAYSSSLDEFIMDRPQIKMWIHGHTHEPFDYMIENTRIICNPRGYIGHEERADNFKLKFVEI
jgi:predicted phosphodiesterase